MNIRKFLRRIRLRTRKLTRKFTIAFLSGLATMLSWISCQTPLGFCTSDSTSEIISQWMPTIVSFAMLGMVLGLLKKYAK